MSSTQFDEAMKGRLLDRAETVWRGAQAKRGATRSRWWLMAAAGAAAALIVGRWVAGPAQASERSSVPFGRGTVVSAAIVGAGAAVEDVLPPEEKGSVDSAEAHAAAAEAETAKVPVPGAASSAPERCPSCEAAACAARERRATEAMAPSAAPALAVQPAEEEDEVVADEDTPPGPASVVKGLASLLSGDANATVVNVGSQFPVILDVPVTTGGAGGPVSGHVAEEVQAAGRVVIPAGSRVAGEALSFGLLGSVGGLVGAAEYGVTSAAGRELSGLEQTWRLSNKTVRVPQGTTVMVYLRADLSL